MSRKAELKEFIQAKRLGEARSLRKAENCKLALSWAEQELADLEKKAIQPREWFVCVDQHGDAVSLYRKNDGDTHLRELDNHGREHWRIPVRDR